MRRLPWILLAAAGIAGCPQPTNRPDATLPDVVVQDRPSDTLRPDTTTPADMQDLDATEPMDVQSLPDSDPTDAMIDGGGSGPSAGIRAVQMAAAGSVNVRLENVLVTYVTPLITGATANNDPAGFSVQAEAMGPALFIAVDPATLMPTPAPGDRVTFTATMTRAVNNGASRWVSAVSMFNRISGSNPLDPFVQDLSSAANIASAVGTYEYELSRFTGTITDNGTNSGAAFRAFAVTSAGVPAGDANLRVRLPEALANMLGVRMGCRVTLGPTPLWRFRDVAQVSGWRSGDIMVSGCPAAMDGGADVADARSDTGVPMDVASDARTDTGVPADTGVDVRTDAGVPTDTGVDASVCTPRIVINEVQSAGMAATDEFIEIYNAGPCAVTLTGWTLRYASASTAMGTGNPVWTGTAAHTLNVGQYGVFRSGAVTPAAGSVDLGMTMGVGLANSGGVALFSPSMVRIDSVAFQQMGGTMVNPMHPFREGMTPAVMPAMAMPQISCARVPNGADTNVNGTDFVARTTSSPGAANP